MVTGLRMRTTVSMPMVMIAAKNHPMKSRMAKRFRLLDQMMSYRPEILMNLTKMTLMKKNGSSFESLRKGMMKVGMMRKPK